MVALALSIAMFAVLSTAVNAIPVVVINGDYKIKLYSVNYDSATNLYHLENAFLLPDYEYTHLQHFDMD